MAISKTSLRSLTTTSSALLYLLWVFPYHLVPTTKEHPPKYESTGIMVILLMVFFKTGQIFANLSLIVIITAMIVLVPDLNHTEQLLGLAVMGFTSILVVGLGLLAFQIPSQLQ